MRKSGWLMLAAVLTIGTARADEGMWTFDNFPGAAVTQKYGADITPAWLDRVRTATIRLSNCTASFVSPEGLILTNHHCVERLPGATRSEGQDLSETASHRRHARGEASAPRRSPTC